MTTLPSINAIPAALRARDQWVVWRYEARDKGGKPTKVPYQASWPQRKASSNAPRTWASAEKAIETAAKHHFDGIGYVFSPDDPFVGFDLDDIIGDDGTLADWAKPWLRDLTTYVEVSPSGHGVKGIAIGKLPGSGLNAGCVELYDQGRYFTITAQRYDSFPTEPQPLNGAIDRLYAFAQQEKARHEAQREQRRREAYAMGALRDEVERVRTAPTGTRNDALNRAAFALAQFINEGLLTEDTIVGALASAAGDAGLGPAEIRGTLRSGMRAGIQETRAIPAPAERTVLDAATGELIIVPDVPIKKADLVRAPGAPIDFYDLLDQPRKDIRWFAPGFIREGLGIVAGEANIGKTPLLIQLAIAIASGGMWMNKIQCQQGKVLFIGTEYTRDELGYVIERSAAGARPPRGMLNFKSLNLEDPDADRDIQPETPAEALALLDYFYRVEKYDVVIIDVFTGFLPPEQFKQNVYRGDYKEFKPYHLISLRYRAALIGSWHSVKRESNPRYMYNGSSGLWGVPASRVTMYTDQENRVRLFSMPRFEKKIDWALAHEQTINGLRWVVSDAAPEPAMGPQEQVIYRWLKENADKSNPRSPSTAAEMTGLPANTVRTVLGRMFDKNLVQRGVGNGYYIDVANVAPVADVANVADVALVKNGISATNVAQMLRSDTALGRDENGAQQTQHHFTQHERNTYNNPYWNALPEDIRRTTRMMLVSDVDRNIEEAKARCERYGLNYDEARRIAFEDARKQ